MKALKYLLKGSLILACVCLLSGSSNSNPISTEGIYRGKKLMGNVTIKEYGHADFKVRVVRCGEDLKGRLTPGCCTKPGEWHIVEHGGNFSVCFVEGAADFKIRFTRFPGVAGVDE